MKFRTDIDYRKATLKKLLKNIIKYDKEITEALYSDFRKPAFEALITETSYVISDLKHTIANVRSWAKPKRVLPSLLNFRSTDRIYSEPYGKVLVIAPWNYPFQLAMCPMIAAVAAGNSVVVKPSELTPATSAVVARIIRESFDVRHVVAVLGDASIASDLLKKRWDHIFFTGSVPVGKIVAEAAAKYMTPVTLELGGKNPCIIDDTADLALAARRIVWGKFINAGQTCISPDYILVKSSVKIRLMQLLKQEIIRAYGEDPAQSPDFPRIINFKHFDRLQAMILPADVYFGGSTDRDQRYIAPTIIDEHNLESEVMKDEIFGPILPVLAYNTIDDLKKTISRYEKPLALYVFTRNSGFADRIISDYSFGGGCINDTVIHFANRRLPFGGVGNSGSGAYHGKWGFDTFSHQKSVIRKANWPDLTMRYAPYSGKLKYVKKLLK
jgi:aldehyde dehydrogenase (NAD+)